MKKLRPRRLSAAGGVVVCQNSVFRYSRLALAQSRGDRPRLGLSCFTTSQRTPASWRLYRTKSRAAIKGTRGLCGQCRQLKKHGPKALYQSLRPALTLQRPAFPPAQRQHRPSGRRRCQQRGRGQRRSGVGGRRLGLGAVRRRDGGLGRVASFRIRRHRRIG